MNNSATSTTVTLNNGVTMPALGFGVFQTPPEVTTASVAEALRVGYRLIDTAAAYGNEREVGRAIADSGLDRSQVFIETKLWITDFDHDQALHGFEKAAGKLGVDQIDLLLLHQPLTSDFDKTIGAYKALEELLAQGKVRAIGVSNFMPDVLASLLDATSVVPAVNQVEVHPYFTQADVQKADADAGILTQAWSPMGGITSYGNGQSGSTFTDPVLRQIGEAHGKTTAQVMLARHLAQGRSAIPKSVKPERIAANFDVFGFQLSADELARIDALDKGVRGGPEPSSITLANYSIDIPEA